MCRSRRAELFTVAAKAGCLFGVAHFRVGPIGALTYTHESIAGYIETGDVLLTQIVGRQDLQSLTGSAGVQVRLPVSFGGARYSPM
ncbi:autotransporter domain-containing protein [Bradyrhizobium sp. 199]|nr:autotransporter domain-containing protein [Bradyrhizobium sp. 199]